MWVQNGPRARWAANQATAAADKDSQPKVCHGNRFRKSRETPSHAVTATITIPIDGVHQHPAAASRPEANHNNLLAGLNVGKSKDQSIKAALSSRWHTETNPGLVVSRPIKQITAATPGQ